MRQFFKTNSKSLIIFTIVFVGIIFGLLTATLKRAFADDNSNDDLIKEYPEAFHVIIFDEGEKLSIKTDAETVGAALERAGLMVSEFDSVDPSLDSEINADNFYINIYRARPTLVIDGLARKFLMTSSYDAKEIAQQAGFSIFDGDKVEVATNSQFLEVGVASAYEIIRGEGSTITVEEDIPFEEETKKDFSLGSGKVKIVQLGEVGKKSIIYSIKMKNGIEISREPISETIIREPVSRITNVGADPIEMHPLTSSMGRNRYTVEMDDGSFVERQETYYDLNMSGVMHYCGRSSYTVREDGAKVDADGYVLVAANLSLYPRCSVVQTSLGLGKVYDTGAFAAVNPEQFDLATDWTKRDGI